MTTQNASALATRLAEEIFDALHGINCPEHMAKVMLPVLQAQAAEDEKEVRSKLWDSSTTASGAIHSLKENENELAALRALVGRMKTALESCGDCSSVSIRPIYVYDPDLVKQAIEEADKVVN